MSGTLSDALRGASGDAMDEAAFRRLNYEDLLKIEETIGKVTPLS